MTVSSSASSFRPGVCTSTNRPISPYEGQVIYETDTDRTLVWNSSSWVYLSTSTAYQPGLELIASQSFTDQSYVEVTGFSSAYEWYEISFSAVRASTTPTGTAVLGVLYNGSTPRASQYYGGNHYIGYTGTDGAQYNQNAAGDFYCGTYETRYRGNFTMNCFYKAGEMFSYNVVGFDSLNFRAFYGGGFRNGTESWDRIRLTGATGPITGQWVLCGRKK